MKKKHLFTLMISTLALAVASCGTAGSDSSSQTPSSSSSQAQTSSQATTSSQGTSATSSTETSSSIEISSSEEVSSSENTPSSSEAPLPVDQRLVRINVSQNYNGNKNATDRIDTEKVSVIHEDFDKVNIENYKSDVVYTNKLAKPTHTVDDLDEFSGVLDYYAFYGDDSTFTITLSNDYPTPNEKVINMGFYHSKLAAGVVGLNYLYDAPTKSFAIQMLFNNEAANYKAKWNDLVHAKKMTIPYEFPSEVSPRTPTFDDFGYKTKNVNGTLDVYNSEQLLYALEFGYLPNVLPDSPAEIVMNRAKEILRAIIRDDMTPNDKIAAIYSWIIANNTYDTVGEKWAVYTVEEDKYPDYLASGFRSFYAEGGLIDGLCVCQGYAKTFNILANIEGIDAVKVSARYEDDTETINSNIYSGIGATYSNHGYSYVKNDGDNKYYIVDVTYGSHSTYADTSSSRQGIYRNFAAMYTFEKWTELYSDIVDRYHENPKVGTATIDFTEYRKMGTLDMHLSTKAELGTFIPELLTYMSTYNDPNFKTSDEIYQINLTIDEVANDKTLVDDLFGYTSGIFNDNGIYWPGVRIWADHYFQYDTGLLIGVAF